MDPLWTCHEQEGADRETRRLGMALRRHGQSVVFSPLSDARLEAALSPFNPSDDIVFNWCEGLPGVERSEPLVAEILERLRYTYTGSSAETLRLSYEKEQVKRRLESRGIPTPAWRLYASEDEDGWDCFPAIVKPAREHCSYGVTPESVVTCERELRERVRRILAEFRQPALVEDFIDGREFHVPLWGNGSVDVLPPVEMDFSACGDIHDRLCSYEAKFEPDSLAQRRIRTITPARLTDAEMSALSGVSRAAYEAVGCRDYGRIDVRLRDGVFYVLDVNPNADISGDASLALAAGKAGYSYGAMGCRVLEFASERLGQNLAPHQ
jgi:D-alanine-D-alanine ligase